MRIYLHLGIIKMLFFKENWQALNIKIWTWLCTYIFITLKCSLIFLIIFFMIVHMSSGRVFIGNSFTYRDKYMPIEMEYNYLSNFFTCTYYFFTCLVLIEVRTILPSNWVIFDMYLLLFLCFFIEVQSY